MLQCETPLFPYQESEAVTALKEPVQFERVHNGKYFIEWVCGADLSAYTIEARWKPLNEGAVQRPA